MVSLFRSHVSKWKDCRECSLCEVRQKVVIARGTVPATLLFVGEAPGESEDSIGHPFQGPAGYLLNEIISRSVPKQYSYALTNLVCCIPRKDGEKTKDPPDESILACKPRLEEFIRVCDQGDTLRLIICVGAVARDWFDQKARKKIVPHKRLPIIDIAHPSWILRRNLAQRGLEVQRCVAIIGTAIEDLEENYQAEQKKVEEVRGILADARKAYEKGFSDDDIPF